MSERPVVILSNRGPLTFDDDLVPRRGGGGLVSGLAPLVAGTGATWLAAAMTAGDRKAAAQGVVEAEDMRVRLVDIDPATFRTAYDVICNGTLWFCLHDLFDRARRPRIDARWNDAWDAYVELNRAFAAAAAEDAPEGAAVLVQDYHLALVGPLLSAARPDLRAVHFSHTPWCWPEGLLPLPTAAARALIEGMAGHTAAGFHCRRWAERFERCVRRLTDGQPSTFVAPLATDPADLRRTADTPACASARESLRDQIGDRKLLLRVDRLELSKNVLRGFWAFETMLERFPEWRERVIFVAYLYPSREGLPEYLAYRNEVERTVERLNERLGSPGWTPIVLDTRDDYPRSVAAMQLADAVLVNPIRDGLNLVAKEQAVLSERDAMLVLSTEAGVWDELGDHGAIGVNPFDLVETADAMRRALEAAPEERRQAHAAMRAVAEARTPGDWLADQLAAAG